jgi:serine/threonine-protein kinase
MQPERWQQIDQLFHLALDKARDERALFLAEVCAGDEVLRNDIEELISSHEQADEFIETPASDLAAELLAKGQSGLKLGEKIGPYEIQSVLGIGGMGEVYLATDTRLSRRVALKLLPPQFTLDPERVRRFEQEARAASALNHPNIVTIHEIGQVNSTQFIVTEFVEGQTLRQLMNEKPLSLNEALNVAIQIAGALTSAHAAGIVHRDIKPENIMLRADGYVKILDFGLAKLTETQTSDSDLETPTLLQSNPGLVMGTVQYMSPEQARGKNVDLRTDIWSLGVVLYELLAHRVPFSGETPSHVMVSLMEDELPALTSYANVPAELDRIVTKTLSKNKKGRYQTARELTHDFKNLKRELQLEGRLKQSVETDERLIERATKSNEQVAINGAPASASTADIGIAHPTSSAEYIVSEIKRHRLALAVAAAAVIAATVMIAYLVHRVRSADVVSRGGAIASVAVLPFVNVNNDPDTEYLSDGLSDSVISRLSQLPNLKKVISLNSVLPYKGKQIDPQAVGRELNVGAVLTGKLTLRRDDVLVTTELVDVKDNRRLWGGQYSYKLANVFKLQGEIARDISEKLRLKLTGEQQERLTRPDTESAEAYQLYLQGLYYWWKNTDEATLKSGEYFQQAIEKDPNFGLAYVGLGDYYIIMSTFGNMRSNEALPKAEAAAVKALAIDERLVDAHRVLAAVKMWYDWDWPGAERELKRAIELNPEGFHRGLYNRLLEVTGRIDEAIADASVDWNEPPGSRLPREERLPKLFSLAGRYNEAIEAWKKILEKEPNRRGMAHLNIGEIYARQGRYEEALAEMLEVRVRIRYPRELARIGYVYAVAGKRDEAIKILEEMKGLTGKRYNLGTHIAAIYAALGNKDKALAWLKKACDEHEQGVVDLKVDPRLDTLRADPRFVDLLRRVKLAP